MTPAPSALPCQRAATARPSCPFALTTRGRRSERLQENVAERKAVIGELDASVQLL